MQFCYNWNYMQKTSLNGKKSIHFQNKRAHNLETLEGIHKKNATLLADFITEELWKTSCFSSTNWVSLYQKSSNWKPHWTEFNNSLRVHLYFNIHLHERLSFDIFQYAWETLIWEYKENLHMFVIVKFGYISNYDGFEANFKNVV